MVDQFNELASKLADLRTKAPKKFNNKIIEQSKELSLLVSDFESTLANITSNLTTISSTLKEITPNNDKVIRVEGGRASDLSIVCGNLVEICRLSKENFDNGKQPPDLSKIDGIKLKEDENIGKLLEGRNGGRELVDNLETTAKIIMAIDKEDYGISDVISDNSGFTNNDTSTDSFQPKLSSSSLGP